MNPRRAIARLIEPDPPLPAYLADVPAHGHIYGTLSYNKKNRTWIIRGEPCVTELAKRLFPGCDGRGRGVARFSAHRRVMGELNWLMLRYPLAVKAADQPRFEQALADARTYALTREKISTLLSGRLPEAEATPDEFVGQLTHFQRQGLTYLTLTERCLLADEMGLGKTVQTLAHLAKSGRFPALIIPPPHLVRNWEREICRFLPNRRVHRVTGLKPHDLPDADIYVMHYLLLRGWKKQLPQMHFEAVIFDEVQELRHAGTEKYSAASLVSGACANVIGLSGTPIYNAGGEIWNIINSLDFHFLGDYESFSREWCYGYGNRVVKDPLLLGEHLCREGIMLRRTKADVLPELPPKRRLVQVMDWDDALYCDVMRACDAMLREWIAAPEGQRALIEDRISLLKRQATGQAKAPYVCAFVRTLLSAGEKVLLFAHHHAVMDAFARHLREYSPMFITGRESADKKTLAADAFTQGKTQLLCISLRAASGLNLQTATCVVFGELDWSPAVHSQAEDRAHRMGQTDSLLCYYLVCPAGSDSDMQEALGLKVSQFVQLMGDAPQAQGDAALSGSLAREAIAKMVKRMVEEQKEGDLS